MTGTDFSISEKIKKLRGSVAEVCRNAGRNPEEIRIIYVTKTVSPEKIREAIFSGAQDLGENRVQELQEKMRALDQERSQHGIRWHLIGHLQTNKVKWVAGEVELIHSLDRLELAETLEKQAQLKGLKIINCLIQINSSGEKSKFGLNPEDAENFVAKLKGSVVRVCGLMTVGPLTENREQIRQCFRKVRLLRDDLRRKFPGRDWNILSMGMSGDYDLAIEEGATLIRIGTAVFGERNL